MKQLNHPWIFLILSFVITIVVKIPHLVFPYSFDETFSYYRAVLEMSKAGPSMLPGSIPLISSKGHPLFFYFLASTWLKFVAGDSVILTRIFPLLVSLLALFVFHRFARRHINIQLANIAVVLLAVQSLFLAQSSLILPEVLLFTLFMLCYDSYLSGQYGWYALFGSLMMLTKETAAVFIMVFGLAFLVENFRDRTKRIFWKNLLMFATPVFVYLGFLVLHYNKFGVFFFSEHLNYLSIDKTDLRYKFSSAVWMLFLAQGRNLVFFAAIFALIILIFQRKKIEYRRFLMISLPLFVMFISFTILNFYTYRYLLPVLGVMLIASLAMVQQIKTKYQLVNIAFIVIVFSLASYNSAFKRGQADADLGYTEYLVVHQEMVKYCEQQDWYNKEIGSGYNMVMSLRDHFANYLTTDKNFKTHHLPGIENRDIIIYDSTCWPYEMPENERNKLSLIKRFEFKGHWGEIYRITAKEDAKQIQNQISSIE